MILDFLNQSHSPLLTLMAEKASWPFQLFRLKPLESFCMFAFLLCPDPICQKILLVLPSKCIPSSSTSDHHCLHPGPSHCISPRGYFNSFPLVSLLLLLFPVISILHGGLGDPVRTFRSCYSSAQHLSVVDHLTQSKIQRLSQPPICGPIPLMLPFYLLFPFPIHFTTSSLVTLLSLTHSGPAPLSGSSIHFPSNGAWDAPDVCVDGSLPSFRPLLRCYLLSESS